MDLESICPAITDSQEVPDIGVLSDSSESSNSSSKSSASSDSSDSEHEDATPSSLQASRQPPPPSSRATVNGMNGQQHSNHASISSMPRFSQLSEDLHLSESGSDSDDWKVQTWWLTVVAQKDELECRTRQHINWPDPLISVEPVADSKEEDGLTMDAQRFCLLTITVLLT